MPRKPNDYSKSKIYEIICNITGERYIGSTTYNYLSQRLVKHKSQYNSWKQGKKNFTTSFPIIERGSYSILLLENYPCESVDELRAREGHYQRTLECVNQRVAGRTHKQWEEDNKEKLKEHKKDYHETNKEKIHEKKREYYEQNKERVCAKVQEYRELNREKINEKAKEYRAENTEKIKEKAKEKITCECGCKVRVSDLARHRKTKKHQKLVENKR